MHTSCPDCDAVIAPGTYQCKCGFKLARPQRWLSNDEVKVDQKHAEESERWCAEHGLTTVEEKREFLKRMRLELLRPKTLEEKRAWMKSPRSEIAARLRDEFLTRKDLPEREPGCDDEVIAA